MWVIHQTMVLKKVPKILIGKKKKIIFIKLFEDV